MEENEELSLNNIENLAWAIWNHLNGALKGTANEPYPMRQIKSEILAERDALIKEYSLKNILKEDTVIQDINCIELDCENLSMCCKVETYDNTLHFTMPKLSSNVLKPIKYIGLPDKRTSFKIVDRINIPEVKSYNKYRNKSTDENKDTYVWIANNLKDGFLFNPPIENLKYISISAIFEDPTALDQYACCDTSKDPNVIPAWMTIAIMDKIINRFAGTIARVNYRKNDGQGH